MTHARIATTTAIPVHDAITAHRVAYDAYQVAPEGIASEHASDAYDTASMALVGATCDTAPEALALFRHLMWWLKEEAEYAEGHQPAYDIALARAKDLGLYLTALANSARIPQAMPSGRLGRRTPIIDLRPRASVGAGCDEEAPGTIRGWEAVTPVRPDTAHVRALRVLDLAAETLTAVAIIAGGVFAYGYIPTL